MAVAAGTGPTSRPALTVVGADHEVRCVHPEIGKSTRVRRQAVPEVPELDTAGLSIRGLNARYRTLPILHDVSFEVFAGQCTAVVGESGSGRTTLSRCIAGLHTNWTGEITYAGKSLANAPDQRLERQRRQIQ